MAAHLPGYFQVYGRIFSVSGIPLTSDISINDKKNSFQKLIYPKICYSDKSNKLLITWIGNYDGKYRLWGRFFYSDGQPVDTGFVISEASYINDVFYNDLSVDSSGNFVAAWAIAKDSLQWELQWEWFNPDGELLTQIKTISTSEDNVNSYSNINIIGNYDDKSFIVWNYNKNDVIFKYAKFLSSDGTQIGNKFRISQNDTTNVSTGEFLIKDNKIYCVWDASSSNWMGTFGRILNIDSSLVWIKENDLPNNPNTFILYQNYPNPFNSSTVISYYLPERGKSVTIRIFDILGRVAKEINITSLKGNNRVIWNGTTNWGITVSSGVYIYSIIYKNESLQKKLIYLK